MAPHHEPQWSIFNHSRLPHTKTSGSTSDRKAQATERIQTVELEGDPMFGSYKPPIGFYDGSPGPTVINSAADIGLSSANESSKPKNKRAKRMKDFAEKLFGICKKALKKNASTPDSPVFPIARASSPHLHPTPVNRPRRPIRDFSQSVCTLPEVSGNSSDDQYVFVGDSSTRHSRELLSRLLCTTRKANESTETVHGLVKINPCHPLDLVIKKKEKTRVRISPVDNIYTDRKMLPLTQEVHLPRHRCAIRSDASRAIEPLIGMGLVSKEDLFNKEERLNSVIRTAQFAKDQHDFIRNRNFYDLDARVDGRKFALFGLDADLAALWGEGSSVGRNEMLEAKAPSLKPGRPSHGTRQREEVQRGNILLRSSPCSKNV
ncbi:hypothetical protein BJ508DRAFT_305089 [Ascobolus immersus RN42]|uniref:Uncharacterized protein n=1 Tax=Ascobolus immersus RN42 TaxID=1160509 RepID=A0A3N4INC2_ASCIM|nr:hypothetical protein BJ508DRAFT_305089 [Ascobolus immersus RN42]